MSRTLLNEQGVGCYARWYPADVAVLGTLRADLEGWLDGLGATSGAREALVLATHELVANAVEHSGGAAVHVRGVRDDDEVRIEVQDTGRWRGTSSVDRGRGLLLVARSLASVEVVTGPSGTTVMGRAPLA